MHTLWLKGDVLNVNDIKIHNPAPYKWNWGDELTSSPQLKVRTQSGEALKVKVHTQSSEALKVKVCPQSDSALLD